MLTLARCEDAILYSLGLSVMPTPTSTQEIVNAAGQWFIAANSWSWNQRIGSLSTVASQSYVSLSSLVNFKKLYRVAYTDGVGTWMEQCDLGYIAMLRASVAGAGARPQYAAVGFSQDVTGAIDTRLEIYPTPASSLTDALTLYYASGWFEPTSVIGIPSAVEGLFLQVVRAYAHGLQETDQGTVGARLAQIVQGPEWVAAVQADAATQQNFGPIRSSSIQPEGADMISRWMTGTVPNP